MPLRPWAKKHRKYIVFFFKNTVSDMLKTETHLKALKLLAYIFKILIERFNISFLCIFYLYKTNILNQFSISFHPFK